MSDAIISVEGLGKRYRIPHSRTRSGESDRGWVVYAIQNTIGRIYIGQTGNLAARLNAHNTGLVRSTRKDDHWKLIAKEDCPTQSEVRWLEFQLKRSLGKRTTWLQKRKVAIE